MNSQSGTYYNTEGQFFGDWSTIPPFGDALLDIDEVPQLSSDWSPSASPHQADSDSTDLSTSLVLLSDNTTGASPKSNPRKRRGHTKSRLGCVHCKKRKIKVRPRIFSYCASIVADSLDFSVKKRGPHAPIASDGALHANTRPCSITHSMTESFPKFSVVHVR